MTLDQMNGIYDKLGPCKKGCEKEELFVMNLGSGMMIQCRCGNNTPIVSPDKAIQIWNEEFANPREV